MGRTGRRGWVLVLGLLLVACSSSDDGGDGDGNPNPSPAPNPNEAVLTIQNFTFSPANLAVNPGQTVRVRNQDGSMGHSVTSQSAPRTFTPGGVAGVSFNTGIFTGEATFTIPGNAPAGTIIPYYCIPHTSQMRNTGVITVRASGDPTPVPTDPPPGY